MLLELSKTEIAMVKKTFLKAYTSYIYLISMVINVVLMCIDIIYDFVLYTIDSNSVFTRNFIIYTNMVFVFGSLVLLFVFLFMSSRAMGTEGKWMQIAKNYSEAKNPDTIIECESSEEIVDVAKELVEIYSEKYNDSESAERTVKKSTAYRTKLLKKYTNLVCKDQNIAPCICVWIPLLIFGLSVLKELSFIILLIVAG